MLTWKCLTLFSNPFIFHLFIIKIYVKKSKIKYLCWTWNHYEGLGIGTAAFCPHSGLQTLCTLPVELTLSAVSNPRKHIYMCIQHYVNWCIEDWMQTLGGGALRTLWYHLTPTLSQRLHACPSENIFSLHFPIMKSGIGSWRLSFPLVVVVDDNTTQPGPCCITRRHWTPCSQGNESCCHLRMLKAAQGFQCWPWEESHGKK